MGDTEQWVPSCDTAQSIQVFPSAEDRSSGGTSSSFSTLYLGNKLFILEELLEPQSVRG